MARIQRYRVSWNYDARLLVEIDHGVLTEDELHKINEFWMSSEDRLEECDGNVLHVVLGLLTEVCFRQCLQECLSVDMLIDKFESGIEGWPRMDGSAGIKIINCIEPEFFISDMYVTELGDEYDAH